MQPLITVIINCHNGEKYLREAIESVINQTYENWEIIFWDNFSNDKSKKIVKGFKENRIRYFYSKKFTNLYEARNLAIKKSKGAYICFLDTDDLWISNKLETQVNFIKKNKNCLIQYSNYYVKREKSKKKYVKFKKSLSSGNISKKLMKNYTLGILTVFIKKTIFKNQNFDKKFNIIGDFDFFIKLSLMHKIFYLHKPLAIYRVHDANYSKINLNKYVLELDYWLRRNKQFFNEKRISLISQKYLLFKIRIKLFLSKLMGV
tara:strand:+ start:983 stop:1765 length:783 start_codon:yes stop_codon:yes gene_type:complete